MDRGSEKMSLSKESDNPLNDDLYRCFLEDLYQYIRCNNFVAARNLVKNSSLEYRQKFITQNDTFPFDPLIIYGIRSRSLETLKFVVDECKVDITEPIRLSCWLLFRRYLKDKIHLEGNSLSPLQYAICWESCALENIEFLVDRGADVNSTTSNGVTCLMIAAARDFLTCQFLLSKGVNIGAVDDKGQTAFEYAESANQTRIMKLLVEKGVDPFRVDKHGAKRIAAAYSRGDEETVNALLHGLAIRANTLQLKQIDKHRSLISCYKSRWNSIKPSVAFEQSVSPTTPTLENLQRDLELGLELTSELFGNIHCTFYGAIHETAKCFFKCAFYDQWLHQLTYNIQTFCSPDLDIDNRFTELVRMLNDVRYAIESLYHQRSTLSLLGFGVFSELLKTIIEEAAKCWSPDQTLRGLILLLIRLALLVGFDDQHRQTFRNLVKSSCKTSIVD